jgi:hypothetical protein
VWKLKSRYVLEEFFYLITSTYCLRHFYSLVCGSCRHYVSMCMCVFFFSPGIRWNFTTTSTYIFLIWCLGTGKLYLVGLLACLYADWRGLALHFRVISALKKEYICIYMYMFPVMFECDRGINTKCWRHSIILSTFFTAAGCHSVLLMIFEAPTLILR